MARPPLAAPRTGLRRAGVSEPHRPSMHEPASTTAGCGCCGREWAVLADGDGWRGIAKRRAIESSAAPAAIPKVVLALEVAADATGRAREANVFGRKRDLVLARGGSAPEMAGSMKLPSRGPWSRRQQVREPRAPKTAARWARTLRMGLGAACGWQFAKTAEIKKMEPAGRRHGHPPFLFSSDRRFYR